MSIFLYCERIVTRIKNGALQNTSSGYAVELKLRGYKRRLGRPRKNWMEMDIVRRDLKYMGTTWDEADNWR